MANDRPIDCFSGRWRFLSNFYLITVERGGLFFRSVEHGYQAAKSRDPLQRIHVQRAPTPGKAKRRGRRVDLRSDWEEVKVDIMLGLLRCKFGASSWDHIDLRRRLDDTGDRELIEGNWWHDHFWGVCDGHGKNMLGKLLMRVRKENREQESGLVR